MKTTRKRYSVEFKAKVAMDGMASLFYGGDQAAKASNEAEIEKLHAKIGQLLVERDFLARASGR
jgi:transposase